MQNVSWIWNTLPARSCEIHYRLIFRTHDFQFDAARNPIMTQQKAISFPSNGQPRDVAPELQ